jgi:hypothetical protein
MLRDHRDDGNALVGVFWGTLFILAVTAIVTAFW